MKPTQYISLLVISSLLFACSPEQDQDLSSPEVVYAQSTVFASTPESFAMIYDYNTAQTRLEYRAIKVENSTGDPIHDVVNTFLHHSSILTKQSSLSLAKLKKEAGKLVFSFVGQAQFARPEDGKLFWEALDITLARNCKHHNFSIELLDTQSL